MLTHFLVGKNSTSKYLSVRRFAYKWKFLKKTKFEQNLCHVSLVVRPVKEIYLLVRFHGYIYKNHSRKLEQHTHCHSFFRPFSLLTHCLTRPTLNSIRQTDVDTLMIRTQSRVRVRVRVRVTYFNYTDVRHQILGGVGIKVMHSWSDAPSSNPTHSILNCFFP